MRFVHASAPRAHTHVLHHSPASVEGPFHPSSTASEPFLAHTPVHVLLNGAASLPPAFASTPAHVTVPSTGVTHDPVDPQHSCSFPFSP